MLATPAAFVPLVSQRSASQTYLFVFRGGELLVRESDLELPDESAGLALGIRLADALPVGMLGPRYCCTARIERETAPPAGLAFKNLRALFGVLDEELLGVAGRAFQVAEWARTHRYCGVCGTPTFAVTGERCFKCPACGHVAYPRISPAMMVLIKRDNAILLARHLHSPTNRFTALAGFVEP
ncbi:MAG TPA: NUDIX-like domain-containing protein, partial [Burkholderiaceae bacterium]|nr:NUDIX-like domain-containing protein [Burkholderiaceae bacterium]